MSRMKDKVTLVIGGASGIGEAIVKRFAAEGAAVFLTGRRKEEIDAVAGKIGNGVRGIVADASAPADIDLAVATVVAEHGRINTLVFNAAVSDGADLLSSTADFFDRHFAVNVRGPLLAMRAATPHMPAGSSAIMVGSTGSQMAVPHYGTYAATKAALRSYVRTWTVELAPRGIRVNVLSPGPTNTTKFADVPDDFRAAILTRVPLGRLAEPSEIAGAALFLASDESSYMAGSDLHIDGGMAQI